MTLSRMFHPGRKPVAGLFGVCLLLGIPEAIHAATAILRPAADTSIHDQFPDNNFGAGTTLLTGTTAQGRRTRAMQRFDVSAALPAGATITGARLELWMVADASAGAASLAIRVHRMTVAWQEGGQAGNLGDVAAAGDVTWNRRQHPDIAWGAAGAMSGVDYETLPSATATVAGVGAWSWSGNLAEDVRLWLANPAANHGWMLIADPEGAVKTARRFASREDPDHPPSLVVEYEPPVEAPRLPLPVLAEGMLSLRLPMVAGRSHALESKDAVGPGVWRTEALFPAEPSGLERVFPVAPVGTGRFYRLLRF